MVRIDAWMSDFYGRNWYRVIGSNLNVISDGMYEWRIEPGDPSSIAVAESLGFSLVETNVEFMTTVVGSRTYFADIRLADKSDLSNIVQLTHQMYTYDERFQNRFKNQEFFTKDMSKRYYESSVVNCFNSNKAVTCVAEVNGEIIGYFMMSKIGERTYKGMMTAVKPSGRGKQLHTRMQDFCYGQIDSPLEVINRTQLSNLPVINNHIKQARKLVKVEHIFLLNR
jgi:hypothetical protein